MMFKRLLLLISILCYTAVFAEEEMKRPKIALVLSGGGGKGFAHLGVLKVLEQEEIPIDIIVGTSIGSIVGGLYAIGYSADDIIKLAEESNWLELLSDVIPRRELDIISKTEQQRYIISLPVAENKFPVVPGGMVNGQNVLNFFCGLTANIPEDADFTKFPIPFACVGTDLETGKEIIMTNGFLPTAIYASMAIPGIFTPGKHNGHLLVDGGIVNNFPTDVAKKMGADIIIGVDLRRDLYQADKIASLEELVNQLISFYSVKKDSVNNSLCDLIIRPDITGYNTYSFSRQALDTLKIRGQKSTMDLIDQIRNLKTKYQLPHKAKSTALVKQQRWMINGVKFSGNYSVSDNLLKSVINKTFPKTYDYEDIKQSINSLYGMGVFKRIFFKLEDDSNGKILHLFLEEDKAWNFNMGIRIDTRNGVSAVLNTTRKDYTKNIGLLSLTANASSNPNINFLAEMDKKKLPKIALQLDGYFNRATYFISKKNHFDAKLYGTSLKVFSYQSFLKHSIIGGGIKQEFYGTRVFNINGNLPETYSYTKNTLFHHLYAYYLFDNLDDFYFPAKGSELYTEIALTEDLVFDFIKPIWLLKNRNVISLSTASTLILNAYARTLFNKLPLQLNNFVVPRNYESGFNHHFPFYGLPSIWATERNTFIACIEFRNKFHKRHYLTFAANALFHNNEFELFDSYKTIFGGGITYTYKTPFGPAELTVGYSDAYRKPIVSVNIGYWF